MSWEPTRDYGGRFLGAADHGNDTMIRPRVSCVFLLGFAIGMAELLGTALPTAVAQSDVYEVRLGYVIPENRSPQPNAVRDLRVYMDSLQLWFADQMERNGFGPKTFASEMAGTGDALEVHQIEASVTDDYIRGGVWGRTMDAVNAAGFSVWSPGNLWVLVPEAHLQQSDSSIIGGFAGGAHVATGGGAGVAILGSDMLPRIAPGTLADERAYAGLIIPEIGPLPLVQDVSFPWFAGSTVSSASSSAYGAIAHEMGHAFGLGHDFRNDVNFHGNLMGNGLRGFRGSLLPDSFPDDETRLSYGAALALNSSRYFNQGTVYHEQIQPELQILTNGEVDPVNGLLQISFSASDESGLAAALLRRQGPAGGNLIAEMQLSSTVVNATFETSLFSPGVAESFRIDVLDAQGNRRFVTQEIMPNVGFNQAPQPFITVSDSLASAGMSVLLDASRSVDDEGIDLVTVEWDLNGDGVFDTPADTEKTLTTSFFEEGTRLIFARLTDVAGSQSISAPLSIRVLPAAGCDFNIDGDCDVDDLNSLQQEGPVAVGVIVTPGENDHFDITGDGVIDNADVDQWLADAANVNGTGSPYERGDANLDGVVDESDFNLWNANIFTTSLLWDAGDFSGDGNVDVSDFNLWNANKSTVADGGANVPEPRAASTLLLALLLLGIVKGRR